MAKLVKTSVVDSSRGRRSLFSLAECRQIAAEFDGTTAVIDALLATWSAIKPNLKRHNIINAAKRGGYATTKDRKPWTSKEDEFLESNWHQMSGDAIAAALGRSFTSVNLRRKRIGISRYEGDELTIRDIEELTRIDHRQWQEFIARGWLKSRERARRKGAAPIVYLTLGALRSLLTDHPEVYDYRSAPKTTIHALELDRLPDPPLWKRVVCRSAAWREHERLTPVGRTVTHGAAAMVVRRHSFRHRSCAEEGGTSFWAPLYAAPCCPRCGCQVSRYSEEGVFTDLDPGNDEVIDIQARKLGLSWRDGKLRDPQGQVVSDREILAALFSAGRRAAKSIKAFEKLLDAGLSLVQPQPLAPHVLLDNILALELRPDQEAALETFVRTGSMTAAHAMSFGKSTLGMVAMTRISGRHLLMVDTQLLREQWIEKLSALAPRVELVHRYKPSKDVLTVLDPEGRERCVIEIYSYQTRAKLDGNWVVGCFDEVHRLPAALAHRHAFVRTQYRIGLSSTPDLRCDGRGVFVSKMTGALVGDDWSEQMSSGVVKRIPVRVLLVEHREHKHQIVGDLLRQHESVVVLCEAIEDGRELELRYGIPFIHSQTKHKLRVLRGAKSMVLSRVGDAGISVPNCEVTVDHSGLFGSRIQSLQRLGRLMHSDRPKYHCILMTREERFDRFAGRVDAIRRKGFPVVEEPASPYRPPGATLLSPALQARVSARENPFLSMLGWLKNDALDAA